MIRYLLRSIIRYIANGNLSRRRGGDVDGIKPHAIADQGPATFQSVQRVFGDQRVLPDNQRVCAEYFRCKIRFGIDQVILRAHALAEHLGFEIHAAIAGRRGFPVEHGHQRFAFGSRHYFPLRSSIIVLPNARPMRVKVMVLPR